MKKIIVVALTSALASSALAWGDTERAALSGLVIGAMIGAESRPREYHQLPQMSPQNSSHVYQYQPYQPYQPICGYNVVCTQLPAAVRRVCVQQNIIDQYGRILDTRTLCN
jgi:hypothetical protein